jgi:hypothetical protein
VDWKRAIAVNQEALSRIVAGFVALLAAFEGELRLPLGVYRAVALGLFKSETALRRLIVIAARGLTVTLKPQRPMPAGLVIQPKGETSRPMAFQLFDARVSYNWVEEPSHITGPRIRMVDMPDPRSQFLALFKRPVGGLSSEAATLHLRRRLDATLRALGNIPKEAQRMARWKARRLAMDNAKFVSPMRPGPPPGRDKHSKAEIDLILRECHALAFQAQQVDTS